MTDVIPAVDQATVNLVDEIALKRRAQQALAIAVNRVDPSVFPLAEKVIVTLAINNQPHQCRYQHTENHIFHGVFECFDTVVDDSGRVCVGIIEHPRHPAALFRWYPLGNIAQTYENMHANAKVSQVLVFAGGDPGPTPDEMDMLNPII